MISQLRRLACSPNAGLPRFLADLFLGQLTSVTRLGIVSLVGAVGLVAGSAAASTLAPSWGIAGRVVGIVFAISIVLVALWAVLLSRILLFFPFPTCRRGCCSTIEDYNWDMGRLYGRERWGVYSYTCRCGDRYERVGRTFVSIDEAGTRSVVV